jgi:hypothetical protein
VSNDGFAAPEQPAGFVHGYAIQLCRGGISTHPWVVLVTQSANGKPVFTFIGGGGAVWDTTDVRRELVVAMISGSKTGMAVRERPTTRLVLSLGLRGWRNSAWPSHEALTVHV